ncbi:MAG: 2OG-Fe(II) oxygenase [Deltaproteobacteria bacterium]|nr:2OG-Fe(II) oxygenase [Deltaproteobacteria bacterium]
MSGAVRERLAALDWRSLRADLDARGWARTAPLLTAAECDALVRLWEDDECFRKRIDMESHRYGRGEYRYLAYPLPQLVRELRAELYRRLRPVAEHWLRSVGEEPDYPGSLRGFIARCAEAGQLRSTPLLLRYTRGGYNCLHQDRYGNVAFPIQAVVCLSRRGVDYEGGDFLLVEQRPRAQSRGESIALERGELLFFPNALRPLPSKRGPVRGTVRHGLSTLTRGERFALGVIFHDAQ